MIELALDFTNYHFILLLLIIIGITAYFYLELKIIKKNLLIINDNFQAPSIDSIIHDNDIDIDIDIDNDIDNDKVASPIKEENIINSNPSDPLEFIMEMPDLKNNELTMDKINNIMTQDTYDEFSSSNDNSSVASSVEDIEENNNLGVKL